MPFASKSIRDRQRRRVAQQVRAGETCCFCREPIRLDLKYPDPLSFTVDHRQASSRHGTDDYENLRPAHAKCNRAASNTGADSVGRNSGCLE